MTINRETIRAEIAEKLDGTLYRNRFPEGLVNYCQQEGFLIVFGDGDDLAEFEGAFRDEASAWSDGEWVSVPVSRKGIYESTCECEDCPHEERKKEQYASIKFMYGGERVPMGWEIKYSGNYSEFEIVEDDDVYCIGLVIDANELPEVL